MGSHDLPHHHQHPTSTTMHTMSAAVMVLLCLQTVSSMYVYVSPCYYNMNLYQHGDSWPCVEESAIEYSSQCYTCHCNYGELTATNTCSQEDTEDQDVVQPAGDDETGVTRAEEEAETTVDEETGVTGAEEEAETAGDEETGMTGAEEEVETAGDEETGMTGAEEEAET